jgi:hypothetical protein
VPVQAAHKPEPPLAYAASEARQTATNPTQAVGRVPASPYHRACEMRFGTAVFANSPLCQIDSLLRPVVSIMPSLLGVRAGKQRSVRPHPCARCSWYDGSKGTAEPKVVLKLHCTNHSPKLTRSHALNGTSMANRNFQCLSRATNGYHCIALVPLRLL